MTYSYETLSRAALCSIAHGPDALSFALVHASQSAIPILSLIIRTIQPTIPPWLSDATQQYYATLHEHTSELQHRSSSPILEELYHAQLDTTFPNNDALLDKVLIAGCLKWGRQLQPSHMQRWHTVLQQWRSEAESLPLHDIEKLEAHLTDRGKYWIIDPTHPLWPQQCDDLIQRTDALPPLCLWGEGDVYALGSCSKPIAIVGSRNATTSGTQTAYALAAYAAQRGHTVISGGALGIDASAHRGTLGAQHEGRTIVVIAGGLHHAGPIRNRPLFDDILTQGGLLLSELSPYEPPLPNRFLLRNRLIAALAATVVIVQAQARSGALNTATWASELHRDVLAIPGSITTPHHRGCHDLIYQHKATLLPDVQALDDWLHAAHSTDATALPAIDANPMQYFIWRTLSRASTRTHGLPLAQCIALCTPVLQQHGISSNIQEITAAISLLELQHYLYRNAEGLYYAQIQNFDTSSHSTHAALPKSAHSTWLQPTL